MVQESFSRQSCVLLQELHTLPSPVTLFYNDMINYWWVTRPKRNLTPVPTIFTQVVTPLYRQEWSGQRDSHLQFEQSLENAGLKRIGSRRDQTGGGARTYMAWLKSLGLIFLRNGNLELTLAGEAILKGENPYKILCNQVLKYQFPSAYSLSPGVEVSPRFKIHPFIFLLRLLKDSRIQYLTTEEVAKIVVTEADSDKDSCLQRTINRILEYRNDGDTCLNADFDTLYAPSKGGRSNDKYGHLRDIAYTLFNWLDYTRLIVREKGRVRLDQDKIDLIDELLSKQWGFIRFPEDEEKFQRAYGLDPEHKKDTRNLDNTSAITQKFVKERIVKEAMIVMSSKRPINKITAAIIDEIANKTGVGRSEVEDIVYSEFPQTDGLMLGFLASYRDMAFSGQKLASEFEIATADIFRDIFGFESHHVGPIGLTPDVLVLSDNDGFAGIFDNKAYRQYSISNDHHNRMVHNYIRDFSSYSNTQLPLMFFSYIAGGFGSAIDSQVQSIVTETDVPGSAIKVDYLISMIENQPTRQYSHSDLRKIFSVRRQVKHSDLSL